MGDFNIRAKSIKENLIGWEGRMLRYSTGYYQKLVILIQILFFTKKLRGEQNNRFIILE